MLLVDQVELLRQHVVHLETQRFALPLMGCPSATTQTYRFKGSCTFPRATLRRQLHKPTLLGTNYHPPCGDGTCLRRTHGGRPRRFTCKNCSE